MSGNEFAVNGYAVDAMQALFAFCEAMDGDVSISDLREVMKLSIDDGHDQMMLMLSMAKIALRESQA